MCGLIRMVLEFVYAAPACGQEDKRPLVLSALHYTYFSQLNLAMTALAIVAISLLTKPQNKTTVSSIGHSGHQPTDQAIE